MIKTLATIFTLCLVLLRPVRCETSPFYYNDEDLTSIQAVGLVASGLSALAGHPNTVALTLRPMTLLAMCKPPKSKPQYVLQVPIVVDTGSDLTTQYYAGMAVFNLPFLFGLVALVGVVALIVSFTTEYQFYQCLGKIRFPGSITGPYIYLGYQSVVGSVTLFSTSSANANLVIGAIICITLWALLLVPLGYLIFFLVPKYATFVLNFAETSQKNRHKRKRLVDHVREYIVKLDAEDRLLLAQHSVIPEYDDRSEAPTTVKSLFSSVMSKLKMWGSQRGIPDEALSVLGPEAERRLRRRQNATYSHMLALKLDDLDKRHSELTEILNGPHRWEDILPEITDIPLTVVGTESSDVASSTSFDSLRLIAKATGFVQHTGVFFETYKRPWFVFVELGMCIVSGIAHGYRPPDDDAMSCAGPATTMAISTCMYSVAVFLLSVHVSWFEDGIVKAISLMQAIASIVALISLVAPGETMELASYLLALLSLYIVILKGLLHTYELLAWWFGVPAMMWPAVDEYMMHFKDMDRENSVSKQAVKKILVAKRVRADDAASNHSSASAVSMDLDKQGEFALEERQIYINEEDEAHFVSVGGRSHAFVSSRGVPLSLLPFRLAPLPKYTPLPARTRTMDEGIRAKKQQQRIEHDKKRLWEQVKHLFADDDRATGYETKELSELSKLAEMQRRMQEASGGTKADKKTVNADNLLGEVRERIEQEYRKNEEIDDLRRSVLKGQIGDDHLRVQMALDNGDFFNGEKPTLTNVLFDSGNAFAPPNQTILNNRSMCLNNSVVSGLSFDRAASPMSSATRPLSQITSKNLTDSIGYNAITNTSIFDHVLLAGLRNRMGKKGQGREVPLSNASLFGRSGMGMSTSTLPSSSSSPSSPLHIPLLQRPPEEDIEQEMQEPAPYSPPRPIQNYHLQQQRAAVGGEVLQRLADIKSEFSARRLRPNQKSPPSVVAEAPKPPSSQPPGSPQGAQSRFGNEEEYSLL